MAALDIGESVHLSELVLPEGVRLMALAHNPENDQPVVSVQHPQKHEAVEEEAAGEDGAETSATAESRAGEG